MSKILTGLLAMCVVFGWQFVAAVLLLLGLSAWSLMNLHGGLSVVCSLVLALLFYRAHDFVQEEIRIEERQGTELEADYNPLAVVATPEQLEELRASRDWTADPIAAEAWKWRRIYAPPSVVLGPTHRGHDL